MTVVSTVLWVNAGQLSPPAGPINATGPTTLNQQDIGAGPLFSINASGSYILTSDIVAPVGYLGDGIAILADNVTLNLNGFALIGVAGSQRGIRVTTPTRWNISIYNGTLRDWGSHGVDAINAKNSQLRNLRVYQNGGRGMFLGTGGTISGCTARANTGDGIRTRNGSTITGCTGSVNTNDGIRAGIGCTIAGCTGSANTGDGIRVSDDCYVVGNNVTDNDRGIDVDAADNIIIKNTAAGNTVHWVIVANNLVGFIVQAPNSGAINGPNGGAGVGTTDPWANITY